MSFERLIVMNQTQKQPELRDDPFKAPGYARSRWAYIWECTFEYFIALLVADQFLTRLLYDLDFDPADVTIIQSLISFAFLFQLASIFIVQRITNVKKVAATVHGISQLLFSCLYLVPFIPFEGEFAKQYRTVIIIACFLLGYFGNYLVTSVIFRWGNSFVDPGKRARYAATKEMTSLISGIVVTFSMGVLLDRFEAAGNLRIGFLFTAIVMFVVCVVDFVCLLLMNNRISAPPKKEEIEPFFVVVRKLFSNKGFVYVVIVAVVWHIANYATVGAFSAYKQNDAGLDYSLEMVTIINNIGCLARFAMSKPIARYTDKRSYSKGLAFGLSIVASAYFINIFTTPELRWIMIAYTILYNIAMAGIGQNLNNIIYNFVEEKYFVQATAIKNSIGGICGFLAGVAASRLIKVLPVSGTNVSIPLGASSSWNFQLYGPQVLSLISFVLCIITILFVRLKLEKIKVIAR